MLIKKYLILTGLFVLAAVNMQAQESQPQSTQTTATTTPSPVAQAQWSNRDMTYRGKNYDVLDSSYYPKSRAKQFHKYIEHQEIFPPKPRNQWEVGVGFGLYNVMGNVPTQMLWNKGGGGISVHVRKALGYIFSLRMQYIYGVGKNLDLEPTTSYDGPYTRFGYTPRTYATATQPAYPVYRATRMEASQLSLDLMFNAYNINFHQARNSMSFFGYFGLGALGYKTRVNALDGQYAAYDFNTIVGQADKPKKVRKALQKGMDKSYESVADYKTGATILDKKHLIFAPSIGAGVAYKFSKKINVQLEDRYTFPVDGYLDGTRYNGGMGNVPSNGRSNDAINYLSVTINYNLNTKKKAVEPLWWINPLDHAYSELSYPRHMILPNPVLPDDDRDGVTDQFDKCPKTPDSLAVNTHGCPMDSDGDGVPDYKDKQFITPTECQPVDADGVGNCPCPDACKDLITGTTNNNNCPNLAPGTLLFTNNAKKITTAMEAQLATIAAKMQANPKCKVVILGGGAGSKTTEQHAWEHVNTVIEFMSETHNISRDRFIFKYGEAGDADIVTYRPANGDESGPSNVPPPHPEIKE